MVPADPPVYPVGRLDADSEGLLILTNDGDLTHLVTHPSFGLTKTYTVLTTGRLTKSDVRKLEQGVKLDDGPARAKAARLIDVGSEGSLIEVVMGEGRNREVRRMVAVLGQEVSRLVRTAIGPIRDQKLKEGEWRELSADEVWGLCSASRQPESP
ncbi:MAG: rRNA pseudouridine synthase [Acidimicrobiia bacterium]|nr:rRNA pseudouridine synthase [Acidimicrobiia bacterium]